VRIEKSRLDIGWQLLAVDDDHTGSNSDFHVPSLPRPTRLTSTREVDPGAGWPRKTGWKRRPVLHGFKRKLHLKREDFIAALTTHQTGPRQL
jgi:hypothetical protein